MKQAQKKQLERHLFAAFGMWGLMAYLWSKVRAYPDVPAWQMLVTVLPLCIFTVAWVLLFSIVAVPIAWIAERG